MFTQLHDRLTPQVFSNDEDLNQLANFLQVVLLALLIFSLVHTFLRFFLMSDFMNRAWIDAIALLGEIGLLFMLRRGRVYLTGNILILAIWLLMTLVVVSSGNGLFDPAFIAFSVVLVIAGFIWGGRGALVMAAATSVLGLLLLTPNAIFLWLNDTFTFAMIAVLIGFARRSIYQALHRARDSERTLEAQNEKLRREIAEHQQAKLAQHSAEDKYRSMVENAAEGIFQSTPDGRVLSANPALARIFGYDSPQELMSAITDAAQQIYVHPERRQEWMSLLESKGEVRGFETEIYRKQGDIITVVTHIKAVRDASGNLLYYEGILEDITERKRAEEALHQSEERYRIVSELISDYAYSFEIAKDGSFHLNWATESITRLTGYSLTELSNSFSIYHPEDQPRAEVDFKKTIAGQETQGTYRCLTKTGQTLWLEVYRRPVWDETLGRVIRYVGVGRDITQRKLAEETVAQERNLLRTLIDHLPEDIFIADRQCRFLINNSVSMQLLGVAHQKDVTGKNTFDFFPREIAEGWHLQGQAVMETGQAIMDQEREQPWRSGDYRWVLNSVIPLRDANNQVIGVLGVNRDITERKRAEEALRKSEERYRIVSELISDYAYSFDVDEHGAIHHDWTTESFTRLTEYTPQELGSNFDLYHPDDLPIAEADTQRTVNGQPTWGEYRIISKSGETQWVELHRHPVWDETLNRVTQFYGVARNITERKRAEVAQRDSEERYRIISELISDYAFSVRIDSDGSIVQDWHTASLMRRFGYTPEEVTRLGLTSLCHRDDLPQLQRSLAAVLQGNTIEVECRLITKRGETCWVQAYAQPVVNEKGQVIRFYGVIQDISERKAAETLQIEMAVAAERQRVEVLKGFLSDATHDLRTPITIMSTSLHLLERTTGMPEKQPRYIKQLKDQTRHIKDIIENMFSLTRLDMAQEDFNFGSWDLNHVAKEVAAAEQVLIAEKQHSLVMELTPQDLAVIADSTELTKALKHILVNALNYTPNGGLITLKTYQRDQQAVIEVTDSGIGISPEDLPRIFERFYRVDKARQLETGTSGLGLTIARKILQAHHGEIEAESTLGIGSTFRIIVPIACD